MLMSLGEYVFELKTLAPNDVNAALTMSWPKQARYQGRPALQFTGVESETLNLSGILYPNSNITGTETDLRALKDMAISGEDYVLAGGDGYVRGVFAILSVTEKHTFLDGQGQARKIEFEVSLERTDDGRVERIET